MKENILYNGEQMEIEEILIVAILIKESKRKKWKGCNTNKPQLQHK